MTKKKYFLIGLIGILGIATLYLCFAVAPFSLFHKGPPQNRVLRGVAWFNFDKKNALAGWEEKIFKDRVRYSIKTDRSGTFLDASSNKAASGLLYWLKFNPRTHPMVSWKWKVVKFPERKTNYKENWWIEKDDYAARFYVIFPRFPFFRLHALEYVWDKTLPKETLLINPYFKNLKIIVTESGPQNLGKWVNVERNIYDDYKKYFGKEPPNVGAIAIMTDADNTESTAIAQYNDIEVGYGE